MKGTKRVTLNHSQTHSDPSPDPSAGIPLPGQPSPGLSSPQDHGSGSSCESYWEPESLISADFLQRQTPMISSAYIHTQFPELVQTP